MENVALAGVSGDTSNSSVVVTAKLRVLRLEDDMFFRWRPEGIVDLFMNRAGDAGACSSPSCVAVLVRDGVAGDSVCTELPE